MTTNDTTEPSFTITKLLPAHPDEVWRAWTDHQVFAAWMEPFGLDPASVTLQPHFGGRYVYVLVNKETGDRFPTGGVYLDVQPRHRLVFTWGEPGAPVAGSPTVAVDIAAGEEGASTQLNFRLSGFAGESGDGFVYDGWDRALTCLAHYLQDRAG